MATLMSCSSLNKKMPHRQVNDESGGVVNLVCDSKGLKTNTDYTS